MQIKDSLTSIKTVFSKKNYLLLSLVTAILFYSLNAIIHDIETTKFIISYFPFLESIKLLTINIFNLHYLISMTSLVFLIIVSVLFGMLISLITYRTKKFTENNSKKTGIFGGIGAFLSVAIPGCVACGAGVAPILGLSAFLTFLPYNGLELSILATVILIFTNYKVSKTLLNGNSCKIKLPKENERR